MSITAHRLFFTDYRRALGERRAEHVERRFFDSLQLRNGTTKQTATLRLCDVDQATTRYFRTLQPQPRTFLDVAVSSGVCTGEWYRALREAGLAGITMTGTDLTLHAYLVEVNRYFRVLVQQGNYPLQYDLGGIPISTARRGRRGYLDGTYLATWLLRRLFGRLCARHQLQTLAEPGASRANGDRIRVRRLQLISPEISGLSGVAFVDDDLSAANDPALLGRFDVLRAANILNCSYFPEPTLVELLTRLRERLRGPGAFLLVCRTRPGGANDATLFRFSAASRFEVALRVGSGSEIEPLVLSLSADRP